MSRAKRAAAVAAVARIETGMTLGLGTGSTVQFALEALGERVRNEGLEVRGVATSRRTQREAQALGIPLTELARVEVIDLTIDGADEVDPQLNLIKGGGGALLREKIVAAASRQMIVIVDRGKCVERLGRAFPLPVEIVPFARAVLLREFALRDATPALRLGEDGATYRTANGNEILDCRFPAGIDDPARVEAEWARLPGVVETGLFVGLADRVLVGQDDGEVEELSR